MEELSIKVNDKIDVKIEDLNSEGYGVAKINGYTLFVNNAMPGERCYVEIIELGKNFGFAKCLNVRDSSIYRIKPLCSNFGECGGCDLMHVEYKAQLQYKKNKVIETIKRIGGVNNVVIDEIVGMENPYYYRNKVQMNFGYNPLTKKVVCGYYKKKTHSIIQIDKCYLQDDNITDLLKFIKNICNELKITAYNETTHKGVLRHVLVRKNVNNDYMVVFVTNSFEFYKSEQLVEKIINRYPNVKSIYQNINLKQSNVILGEQSHLLYGEKYLLEDLCGLKFNVSYKSFFQVNHVQTEKLYNLVLKYASSTGNKNIIDGYCGVGTISLLLSKQFNHVYGIEVVSDAIKNAKANAKLNDIKNVEFIVGKVEDVIENYLRDKEVNTIVLDPPRKGLEKSVIYNIIDSNIKNIIYVSCNVSTFARDFSIFKEHFNLKQISVVDMFPETVDVECVAYLEKK